MQPTLNSLKQSASVKVLAIGVLILVLLIPMAMIKGVINERQETSYQARHDIMRSWGGEQLIAGPVFVVPYERVQVTQYGERIVSEDFAYLLPERVDIDSSLGSEVRYRGLHEIPVYTADIDIAGVFGIPSQKELGLETAHMKWDHARIALGVSDARAVTAAPSLELDGHRISFVAGGQQIDGFPPQIVADVGDVLANRENREPLNFDLSFQMNGTDALRFVPLGDTTTVAMQSSWASPSFAGNYLPQTRAVNDDGFTAQWKISSLGRELPSYWIGGDIDSPDVSKLAFGVQLFMPVGLYQKSLRATKYAVLFIGLTFVAYFLFEIISGLRLHPLQYLLVGFANTLFYLLLLSLAEHTGFGWAYTTSAIASSGLIVAYSYSILESRRRAVAISVILVLLYSFLYMTLQAESYAMLAGAIGLWFSLAITMYLTRRVNWYGERTTTRGHDPES